MVCKRLIFGENFSRTAELILPPAWNHACSLTFSQTQLAISPVSKSGLRPEMSLEFEYRRLAAACLDLAKWAAVLADKTRLLLIAEAWLDLADRVTRNGFQPDRIGDRPRSTHLSRVD